MKVRVVCYGHGRAKIRHFINMTDYSLYMEGSYLMMANGYVDRIEVEKT